jgi:hypothetical protein
MTKRVPIRFEEFSFGSILIDGTSDGHGVVIGRRHIHKIPRHVWTHTALNRGRHTLEVSAARDRIGTTGRLAGHRVGEARSASPENQIGHIADRCRRRW